MANSVFNTSVEVRAELAALEAQIEALRVKQQSAVAALSAFSVGLMLQFVGADGLPVEIPNSAMPNLVAQCQSLAAKCLPEGVQCEGKLIALHAAGARRQRKVGEGEKARIALDASIVVEVDGQTVEGTASSVCKGMLKDAAGKPRMFGQARAEGHAGFPWEALPSLLRKYVLAHGGSLIVDGTTWIDGGVRVGPLATIAREEKEALQA